MNMRGALTLPVLGGAWGLGGLGLFALQAVTSQAPWVNFLADGVVVALVLFLVKKVSDITASVARLDEKVDAFTDRIQREIAIADKTHESIHDRLDRLEGFHGVTR